MGRGTAVHCGGTPASVGGRPQTGASHRAARRLVLGILLACTGALVATQPAAASKRPPGGDMQRAVVREIDIAQPAIVRIATLYYAHVTITLPCGQYTLPTSSKGYLTGGTGSGAFISANGDILTADHVVNIPEADLQTEVVQTGASDIANLLNNNPACHLQQPVTADEVAAGFLQLAGIPFTTQFSTPQSLVWQSTSFAGPTSSSSSSQNSFIDALLNVKSQLPATILASSSFNDNDLAIVHVDLRDTPSIELDNSSEVAVEDQLTIIGFPGNGDATNNATDLLTPSVNNITVSAIKNGTNGEKLIQVGGNVEHGDSGGPALDANGRIVGVVSFGGDDPRGITAFLRSSNNALSLMSQAHVSAQPGTLQTLWRQAFTDYAASSAGHWHKAARELDDLATRYPSFHGIADYRAYADNAALLEPLPDASVRSLEMAGAALALLLAVVLLVVLLVLRRRRHAAPTLAGAPGGQALYGGYPYQAGAYGGYGPPSMYGSSSAYNQPPNTYGGYGPPSNYLPSNGYPPTPAPAPASPSYAEGSTSGAGYSLSSYPSGEPSYPLPSAPQTAQPVAPGTSAIMQSGEAGSATRPGYCLYGHPMGSGEIYCATCGAPRAQG